MAILTISNQQIESVPHSDQAYKPTAKSSVSTTPANQHTSKISSNNYLSIASWQVNPQERWAIVGGNDAQRSAIYVFLQRALNNTAELAVAEVSPLEQERIIQEENLRAQTGLADEINTGRLVQDFLAEAAQNPQQMQHWIETFQFTHCLTTYFRDLSSGETRRALLIKALQTDYSCYLLHDPYEGLDKATRQVAQQVMESSLAKSTCCFFIASRPEQLPSNITHLAYIKDKQLICEALTQPLSTRLQALSEIIQPTSHFIIPDLPEKHPFHKQKTLDSNKPLVAMRDVSVAYADQAKPIFEGINLTIHPLEHTHITGPNGAGKSTLLKLITGDHPQVYNNAIETCGYRRGDGESIWDVKRFIGYMGGEMLWNYRSSGQLAGKTLNVVISGLHDSIGLYQQIQTADKQCAMAWLTIFDMQTSAKKRFNQLSMAEQRLALIARALIKRPALLILDEPCQGLDSVERSRVLSVIEKLIKAKACTVLYVSHHDDEQIAGIEKEFLLNA